MRAARAGWRGVECRDELTVATPQLVDPPEGGPVLEADAVHAGVEGVGVEPVTAAGARRREIELLHPVARVVGP